jgi:glycosyltransferase involved in cell wall biosynthesis
MFAQLKIGAIIPARDEELAIAEVVRGLSAVCHPCGSPVLDYIVVSDNGSRDATAELARKAGAMVVSSTQAGYGHACLAAMAVMPEVDVLLYVDGDRSIYPEQIKRLLLAIAEGADLVLGGRHLGTCETHAMTLPQRFGTRLAVHCIRLIWRAPFGDLGPLRAIRRSCYEALSMRDQKYGWTIEMQVKAFQKDFSCIEVPVDTRARLGKSKISGTVKGVLGAGYGMLSMIAKLWMRERKEHWRAKPHVSVDVATAKLFQR